MLAVPPAENPLISGDGPPGLPEQALAWVILLEMVVGREGNHAEEFSPQGTKNFLSAISMDSFETKNFYSCFPKKKVP